MAEGSPERQNCSALATETALPGQRSRQLDSAADVPGAEPGGRAAKVILRALAPLRFCWHYGSGVNSCVVAQNRSLLDSCIQYCVS